MVFPHRSDNGIKSKLWAYFYTASRVSLEFHQLIRKFVFGSLRQDSNLHVLRQPYTRLTSTDSVTRPKALIRCLLSGLGATLAEQFLKAKRFLLFHQPPGRRLLRWKAWGVACGVRSGVETLRGLSVRAVVRLQMTLS